MTYNPFTAALSAAAAELSSPAARRFYSIRSQQDLQTALVFIVQFGCVAIALGETCRQWVSRFEHGKAQSRYQVGGALAVPASHRREVGQVAANYQQSVGNLIPVTVLAIASITRPALLSNHPIALLNPAPKPKRTRKPAQAKAAVKGDRIKALRFPQGV